MRRDATRVCFSVFLCCLLPLGALAGPAGASPAHLNAELAPGKLIELRLDDTN
jgi:hypothetical protein